MTTRVKLKTGPLLKFADVKVGEAFRLAEGTRVYIKIGSNGFSFQADSRRPPNSVCLDGWCVFYTEDNVKVRIADLEIEEK
jgi:hypothetical protein